MLLKKIAISGLGGVGGYYAGQIMQEVLREKQGREVYFIARGEHLRAIRENGLSVITPSRRYEVEPTAVIDSEMKLGETDALPKMDLIIVATKSYDLEHNIEQLRPLVGEQTIILPLLNGANITERIQKVFPNSIVWYGCTYISGRKKSAGVVELLNDAELFLYGSAQGSQTKEEAELLDLLLRAGIKAENHLNIKETIYKKFAMISATATGTSYFNCLVGEALNSYAKEMEQLVDEVLLLIKIKGFDISEHKSFIHKRQRIMPPETTSSMHVDFLNNTTTELENLTGYVVREAQALGLSLPLYERTYKALRDEVYPPKLD